MKKINKLLLLTVILFLFQDLFAVSINQKTLIVPELIYRQAYLDIREDSIYNNNVLNYMDQLYFTLKLVRTYNFINEIVLEPAIRTNRENPGNKDPEFLINQGYISTYPTSFINLTLGKKTEFFGTGHYVNPSDLLNEDKDIFDSLYQKEGKIFSRITYNNEESGWSTSLGYIPYRGKNTKFGKTWITFNIDDIAGFESNLQTTYNDIDKWTFGASFSRFLGNYLEFYWDGRYQTKQRQKSLFEEREFSLYKHDDKSGFYLLGTRLIFTPKRTFILEGIQNQSGLLPNELKLLFESHQKKIKDGSTVFSIHRLLLRHYLLLAYRDEDSFNKTSLEFGGIYNMDDKSCVVTVEIKYALNAIISFAYNPVYYFGKEYSEFGENAFRGGHYFLVKGRF